MLRFRIKIKRLIISLFAVSFSSFLMFGLWLNVKSNNFLVRLSMVNSNYLKVNDSRTEEHRLFKVSNDNLPWFFSNGSQFPNSKSEVFTNLLLFPSEYTDNDRIVNQLMFVPFNYNRISNDHAIHKSKFKKVLLHIETGGWNLREMQLGQKLFANCPVSSCELIADADFAETADALLFKDRFQTPKHRRPPKQVWILYLLECPLHTQNFHEAANQINWTATYRHDSDIVTPYEKFVSFGDARLVVSISAKLNWFAIQSFIVAFDGIFYIYKQKKSKKNYAKGKTKKVAWFVSNCGAKNNRLQYAKELKKHIEVDIYGSCGDKVCSRSRQRSCFEMLNKDYKFYLAFENSNCRDYITEKFYVNGLKNDILPIAMGAHPYDYERNAPPRSFLHVDNFKSAQHLAEYLHKLDSNDTLYNSYFDWKQTGEFINTRFWCRLCAMLHHANLKPKMYRRLNDWWSNYSICKNREHISKWEHYMKDSFPKPG